MVVTNTEVYNYLGLDDSDDPMIISNIARLINTADSYLKGAIGVNYPLDDPRSKEIALIIIADLYDNRGSSKESLTGNTRRLVDSMSLQLRLEMSRGVFNETV